MTFPQDADSRGQSAAGPVAGQDPSPSQAAGEEPSPTPPADETQEQESDETQVEEDLDALLADTKRERDEYLELAKRTKADFENYRKRVGAEIQAAGVRGKVELAHELIGVVDNLERALQVAGLDPEGDSPEGLAHGVLLVFRSLREALARNGIEALDPQGEKFDPEWHEALSTRPGDGAEPGTVMEVMQKGYRLDDKLIRPARVTVSE